MNTDYFNRFHAVVESGQTRLLTINSVTSQFETTLKPSVRFDMLQAEFHNHGFALSVNPYSC